MSGSAIKGVNRTPASSESVKSSVTKLEKLNLEKKFDGDHDDNNDIIPMQQATTYTTNNMNGGQRSMVATETAGGG